MQWTFSDLVIFDIETTGYSPRWHEIIQIAAVRLDPLGVVGDVYSTYVRPDRAIPAHITELTGITDADVADAPSSTEALRAFAHFVGNNGTLLAHNGHRFDMRFIAETSRRCGLPQRTCRFLDSLWLSKKLWPTEPFHNLDAIISRLGISDAGLAHSRHDARADVHLLADAVRRMLLELCPDNRLEHVESQVGECEFVAA